MARSPIWIFSRATPGRTKQTETAPVVMALAV